LPLTSHDICAEIGLKRGMMDDNPSRPRSQPRKKVETHIGDISSF
jgi:hypothetical protein